MKYDRHLPLMLFMVLILKTLNLSAQDQITSVSPSSVYPGQSTDIVIHGMGTTFKSGVSTINFGPGITSAKPTIINTETIDAYITVSKTAPIGFNDITVTTGNDIVVKHAAIQIFTLGSGVKAAISVMPVQTIHLSDFDPNNVANAPLLFTVTIYNDATVQNLTVVFTLKGLTMGQIGTATKIYRNEPANKIETLTNRQFDKYQVSNTNTPAIQAAIQTGILPSDVYDYHISVLDDNGNDLADADGSNTISNPENKPELISPGSPFTTDPSLVSTKQPLFQWFAQANSFTLTVFEIYPGQKTSAAVAINRPVYIQSNLTGSTYLYPAGATLLDEGHTYAWQITANYTSASGPSTLSSDLNWFTISTSSGTGGKHTVSSITVSPNEATVGTGQSFKFTAKAFDLNNDTVSIQPTWSVVPAEGDIVDNNGNFKAGQTPNTLAVIAAYGDIKDYATVYVTAGAGGNSQAWDISMFMKQVFGLPSK